MSFPRWRDADSMKGGETVRSMIETMVEAVEWGASPLPLGGRGHVFTSSIGSHGHFNTLRLRGAKSERPRRATNRASMTRSRFRQEAENASTTCGRTASSHSRLADGAFKHFETGHDHGLST
jgi:hypothetical protein